MNRHLLCVGILLAVSVEPLAAEDWSLGEDLDRVLAYTDTTFEEFLSADDRLRGVRGGLLMRTVYPKEDGGLRPYSTGMAIQGEIREGQFLLSGASALRASVIEFLVIGGSRIAIDYGLCDQAVEVGNDGSLVKIELLAGGRSEKRILRVDKNQWDRTTLDLPKAEHVVVRIASSRLNMASTNWTGLVVKGDGELGTRDRAREHSPVGDRIGRAAVELEPSPHRVTARPGYDILFYRDKPFLSYAGKGHGTGEHARQAAVGINTYYVEGMNFTRHWPEDAEGVVIPELDRIRLDLGLCQRHDMPFKAAMSMAHCTPFLPAWLVQKENLGFEGHQMRRGGDTHASIFKSKTLEYHQQGLRGWTGPFQDQPSIFVFSQEDIPGDLDDRSDEAQAKWRAWLERRFDGDFDAFRNYVGGVEGCAAFEDVPHLERYEPDPKTGYPMRLSYLKLLWVQETFGDYLADIFAFTRKLRPGVPLTQRYTNSPFGPYASRRAGSDYNYTFGHLSSEGWPNNYAIGRKSWVGVYAHAGTLPLPRGGSIGKTYSAQIRRGPMTEAEWRLNAYTAVANGIVGFEYSPVFPTWGPRWIPAALYDKQFELNEQGRLSQQVMGELLSYSKYMMHYEHHPDVAVFHDAPFNCRPFARDRWSQSKAGIYTLIRETGFHADVLTCWDMTAETLKDKKVLVLAGSLSIAPEIQDAVREYVRAGGTLIAVFCADAEGFPGCNSYAYAGRPRGSAEARSFDNPKAVAHLGDVLGVTEGHGVTERAAVESVERGVVPLASFNELAEEKHWVDRPACCGSVKPAPQARVVAAFEDGAPAAIENRFGQGRAITFAFDLGLIANNVTIDPMYAWWSDLLVSLGCRKAVDTKNWRVEAGAWRDDEGNRVVFLVNHDAERSQKAALPDGGVVTLEPAGTRAVVLPASAR